MGAGCFIRFTCCIELRDSLGRMGQELKQGIMKSVRMAIGSMQRFAQNHWNQSQEAQVILNFLLLA